MGDEVTLDVQVSVNLDGECFSLTPQTRARYSRGVNRVFVGSEKKPVRTDLLALSAIVQLLTRGDGKGRVRVFDAEQRVVVDVEMHDSPRREREKRAPNYE